MDATPDDVLRKILRHAGHATRRVCRRWHAAYGPPAGLYLPQTAVHTHAPTLASLAALGDPLSHTHAMVILPIKNLFGGNFYNSDLLAPIVAAFPTLRTLHLPGPRASAAELRALAPLGPHLTALTLGLADQPAAACLAATLTALRSLTFSLPPADVGGMVPLLADGALADDPSAPPSSDSILSALCCLPHLRSLHFTGYSQNETRPYYYSYYGRSQPAASLLLPLACVSSLTHLALDVPLTNWDQPSLALLTDSWPRLASLSLSIPFMSLPTPLLGLDADPDFNNLVDHHPDGDADELIPNEPHPTVPPACEVIAALAQRTALTALSLAVDPLPRRAESSTFCQLCHHLTSLFRLSSLTLSHTLDPDRYYFDPRAANNTLPLLLAALVAAPRHPPPLTRVALNGQGGSVLQLDRQLLSTCALLAPTLTHLEFTGGLPPLPSLDPLRHLTGLRSLHLRCTSSWRSYSSRLAAPLPARPETAHAILGPLTRLSSVTLWDMPWPTGDLAAMVAALAAPPHALRHLQVCAIRPWGVPPESLAWLRRSLAPASTTLARLTVKPPVSCLKQTLRDLGGLTALRALVLERPADDGTGVYRDPMHENYEPLWGPAPPLWGRSPKGGSRGVNREAGPFCLPPGLRLLVLEPGCLGEAEQARLVAAAARQDCVVHSSSWTKDWEGDVARVAEYDDCNGYADGAAPGYVPFWEGGGAGCSQQVGEGSWDEGDVSATGW